MNWKNTLVIATGFAMIAAMTPAQAASQAERLQVARTYLEANIEAMNLEKIAALSDKLL